MSPPWMPLYIADYRLDTGNRLSAAEHGAYLLLIMEYWAAGSLPDDDRQLARIACMTDREWKAAKPVVQRFFHDGWKHKRIDAELHKALSTIDKRRAAAEEMHNKRRAREHANASANAPSSADAGHDIRAVPHPPSPTSEASASSVEARKTRPEKTNRGSRIPDDFEFDEKTVSDGREEGLTDDHIRRELAKFRDYWRAVPGERGRKLDWQATARNWLREAATRLGRAGRTVPSGNGSPSGGRLAAFQRAASAFPRADDDAERGSDLLGGHGHPMGYPH